MSGQDIYERPRESARAEILRHIQTPELRAMDIDVLRVRFQQGPWELKFLARPQNGDWICESSHGDNGALTRHDFKSISQGLAHFQFLEPRDEGEEE